MFRVSHIEKYMDIITLNAIKYCICEYAWF